MSARATSAAMVMGWERLDEWLWQQNGHSRPGAKMKESSDFSVYRSRIPEVLLASMGRKAGTISMRVQS